MLAGLAGCCALDIERLICELPLRLLDCPARALRHNLLHVLIQRTCLGNRFHSLLDLRIGFQKNLEAFLLVEDRKSTRLNSSHVKISYAVFCLKKKKKTRPVTA